VCAKESAICESLSDGAQSRREKREQEKERFVEGLARLTVFFPFPIHMLFAYLLLPFSLSLSLSLNNRSGARIPSVQLANVRSRAVTLSYSSAPAIVRNNSISSEDKATENKPASLERKIGYLTPDCRCCVWVWV
jgi:hypothetical protein